MIFSKALAIKGFAGLIGCAALSFAGIEIYNLATANTETKQLLAKVGLSCNSNNECSILTEPAGTKLKVKQEQTTFEVTTIPENSGKIKLYRLSSDSTDYHKGLKIVIEGGNITDNTNTLEEFETYEIKEENKNWNLTRKTKALEEKKKILRLPEGESCDLPTETTTTKSCSLNAAKLKAINFEGKGEGEVTIPEDGTVTLKISKKDDVTTYPNGGYKFVLETDKDITIPTSISIKKNTNTEFKIKKEGMVLSLEKAWTVDSLAKKALITGCTITNNTTKECTLGDKINAIIDSSSQEYSINSGDQSKKIKFEENVAEYNQGFKFTVESEISLATDSKKICPGDYEIKEQNNKWYLSKKSN